MELSRRKFFVSAGAALTTLAASDPLRALSWRPDGKYVLIENEVLRIYRPLVFRNIKNAIIRNFQIIAMPGFVGNCAIEIGPSCENCEFIDGHIDMRANSNKNWFGIVVQS